MSLGPENSMSLRLMSLAALLAAQGDWAPAVRAQAVGLVNEAMNLLDVRVGERNQFRALLAEWEEGVYDGTSCGVCV
jgi:hypothetical protein